MTYDQDHPARSIPALADVVSRIDNTQNPHNSPAVAARIALGAAHRAYQAGRTQAIMELMTTEDAAGELGIRPVTVRKHALEKGIGWQVSRGTWLFRPEDIERMRELARPRKRDE